MPQLVPQVRGSVVKVTSGATQISGVVLSDPASHVLTASLPLGVGPLVTIETEAGQRLDGWIVGRDDTLNLALVRVIGGSLPGVKFGDAKRLTLEDEVLSMGYPQERAGKLAANRSLVVLLWQDIITGVSLVKMDLAPLAGNSGGPIFNRSGELVGMAVEPTFVQKLGMGLGGGNYALWSNFIESKMGGLKGGAVQILASARPVPTQDAAPPPTALILQGKVTIGGVLAQPGTRMYARLVHPTLGDLWLDPVAVLDQSFYRLTVSAWSPAYVDALIEFYIDGVKSSRTWKYNFLKDQDDPDKGEVIGNLVAVNLTFG